jgi:hypothetical protein
VVSQDTLQNYNQIKGKKMTAYFNAKNIDHVVVMGNGETIYYALEEKKQKAKDSTISITRNTMGLNKIICSNMKINFKSGKVNNISFYISPEASFIPPHEVVDNDKTLKGFRWRGEARPAKWDVIPGRKNPKAKKPRTKGPS